MSEAPRTVNAAFIAALGELGRRLDDIEADRAAFASTVHEEISTLAREDARLLHLLQRVYRQFDRRFKIMAATITDLQTNLGTLKTKLDAYIAKQADTPAQIDAANTAVLGLIAEVDAANPPPPVAPPAPPAA